MTKREPYKGDFIESSDLMATAAVRLRIAEVFAPGTQKCATGRDIDRPVLTFVHVEKRWVVSKTNERLLKAIFGPKTTAWIGQDITLGVRYLREAFGERNVPTVRVIMPDGIPMPYAARKHYGFATPEEAKAGR